jgi:hypothetical protein
MQAALGLNVFFSHSSLDAEWVARVAAQATGAGVDLYLAEHDVNPGELLSDKVTTAIERSDVVIVLLSKNSLTSVYVQQEIGVAHHARKLVIPILMNDVAESSLGILNGVEYIYLDPSTPHDGLERLSMALSKLIDHQRQQLESQAKLQAEEAKRKQDMIVAGGVLLLIGLMIISQSQG